MIEKDNNTLKAYTGPLSRTLREEYTIGEEYYRGDVKRGLRNSDGTGVLVGVSKVGSVQGYLIQDGQRIPAPGRLYYRGIDLYDIVGAHREAGTFGYEEVAYLLLMGYLPSRPELDHFKDIMNQARKLPKGFTEGMIMHHPSQNIMNELARGVLSLYSYDPAPDNTSIENLLLQSVRLVGSFPSIVANAYAVKRHYFQGESLHIHYPEPELSTAENFLRMIRPDKSYTEEEAHLLDTMLMILAEHGGEHTPEAVLRMAVEKRRLARLHRGKGAEDQYSAVFVVYRRDGMELRLLFHGGSSLLSRGYRTTAAEKKQAGAAETTGGGARAPPPFKRAARQGHAAARLKGIMCGNPQKIRFAISAGCATISSFLSFARGRSRHAAFGTF